MTEGRGSADLPGRGDEDREDMAAFLLTSGGQSALAEKRAIHTQEKVAGGDSKKAGSGSERP